MTQEEFDKLSEEDKVKYMAEQLKKGFTLLFGKPILAEGGIYYGHTLGLMGDYAGLDTKDGDVG